ncbi:hypothetical protein ACJ41O_008843 [Fusarium nematophilum]
MFRHQGPSKSSRSPKVDHPSRGRRGISSHSQRSILKATAQETLGILPGLLNQLRSTYAAHTSHKFSLDTLRPLNPKFCPSYPRPATIKVINEDTLNAAIRLSQSASAQDPRLRNPHVAVVNFANRHSPGGGWLNGAMAQEESICYRSSLALSLKRSQYPLSGHDALYSPYVLVMRHDHAHGHRLMVKDSSAVKLPIVSAVTIAALHHPKVHTVTEKSRNPFSSAREKRVFSSSRERAITKNKMRLALRAAAYHGHRMLVLGALGCGVFKNPPEDVAHCWLEVLMEEEFAGNWWREVWFAVFDPKQEGNYKVFDRILSGKRV